MLMPETIEENELKQLFLTVLAFIGDAVFELLVRSRLQPRATERSGNCTLTRSPGQATSQARMMQVLSSYLTEAEQIYSAAPQCQKQPAAQCRYG